MTKRVLVFDPAPPFLRGLTETLEEVMPRATVRVLDTPSALLATLGTPFDVLFLGALEPAEDEWRSTLREARARDPDIPVVLCVPFADVDLARVAVEEGSSDILVLSGRLHDRVRTAMGKVAPIEKLRASNRALERKLAAVAHPELVEGSDRMKGILERARRVARVPRPVLIVGERGTGKELVARAIHAHGRPTGPFVAVNCAAVPDGLLESELFGHERGAFTGAEAQSAGRFEQASGGTLFLDEISHMSLLFQSKILRAVEYGVITRVGGREEIHVDVRVVAATNVDLQARILTGEFLPDLYDRLAFEVIHVPPLRDRKDEIQELSRHFLRHFGEELPAVRGKVLSPEAIRALEGYGFPGNVRELKNIVERAAYRETGAVISDHDLMLPKTGVTTTRSHEVVEGPGTGSFHDRVTSHERQILAEAIGVAKGNLAEAARTLQLSYHQLRYLCKKHDLGDKETKKAR